MLAIYKFIFVAINSRLITYFRCRLITEFSGSVGLLGVDKIRGRTALLVGMNSQPRE